VGKVFVHHPLKRAELKRLCEPPPPPPEPVRLRLVETDAQEKARRALERRIARLEEEKKLWEEKNEVQIMQDLFRTLWIEAYDFCEWMHYKFEKDDDLARRICHEEEDCLLVDMFSPHEEKLCVYCGHPAIRRSGTGWAGLMVPTGDMMKRNQAFSYLLCDRCAKLPRKAIKFRAAAYLRGKVKTNDRCANGLIRKASFFKLDTDYIAERSEVFLKRDFDETMGVFKEWENKGFGVIMEVAQV
jgi:hypothetical protein